MGVSVNFLSFYLHAVELTTYFSGDQGCLTSGLFDMALKNLGFLGFFKKPKKSEFAKLFWKVAITVF